MKVFMRAGTLTISKKTVLPITSIVSKDQKLDLAGSEKLNFMELSLSMTITHLTLAHLSSLLMAKTVVAYLTQSLSILASHLS